MYNMALNPDAVAQLGNNLRSHGARIVFTNGCFDVLHVGHVVYLEQARSLGTFLVVGLNSDSSVRSLKGPDRPINGELARMRVLKAMRSVDEVVIFETPVPLELVRTLRPDVYVKGGDYTLDQLPEAQVVTEYGGSVHIVPFVEGYSTTKILRHMVGGSPKG